MESELIDKWKVRLEELKPTLRDSEQIYIKDEWLKNVKDLMFGPIGMYKGYAIEAGSKAFNTEAEVDSFFRDEIPKMVEHVILYMVKRGSILGPNDFAPRETFLVRYATVHPKDFKEPLILDDIKYPEENTINTNEFLKSRIKESDHNTFVETLSGLRDVTSGVLSTEKIFTMSPVISAYNYESNEITVPVIDWDIVRRSEVIPLMIEQLIQAKQNHANYPTSGFDSIVDTLRSKIISFGEGAEELLQKAESKQRMDSLRSDLRGISYIEDNRNFVKELMKLVQHPYIHALFDSVKKADELLSESQQKK